MRNKILLSVCILSSILSSAQTPANTAFAVVSNGNGKMSWMNIQEIDLNTGAVIRQIFDKEKTTFTLVDAVSKKKLEKELILKTSDENQHRYSTQILNKIPYE